MNLRDSFYICKKETLVFQLKYNRLKNIGSLVI